MMKIFWILSFLFFTPALWAEDFSAEGKVSLPLGQEVWDVLSEKDKVALDRILQHWDTWAPQRKQDGTAPMMTFEELYEGLGEEEIELLEHIRKIDPKKSFDFQGDYLGESRDGVEFQRIENQWIVDHWGQAPVKAPGGRKLLEPQYLPKPVYEAYEKMMQAMEKDLGKRLLVESGYRSPAYQLYTFCYFMPKHRYSLVETGHWIAIPGYSEHGAPHVQAIDFINHEGVNGEERVEDFEELPEYEWLLKRAGEFGFELSYPRNKPGITFEPWHWRWVGKAE